MFAREDWNSSYLTYPTPDDIDYFWLYQNSRCSIDSLDMDSNYLLNLPPDIPKTHNFLNKKRSNKNDKENNNNNSIESNRSEIEPNIEKEKDNDQLKENNININSNNKNRKISFTREESKNKEKSSSSLIISKKWDINNDRSLQKDNFSINLFTKINEWIVNDLVLKYPQIKIHKPNYGIFTHKTNMVDIYIYLDIQYKNILCITPEIHEELVKLFIDLKIKKKYNRKKTEITEKSKEYNDVLKLLQIYKYINENDKLNIEDINKLIIKLLVEEGYKDPKEENIYKNDKDNIRHLLIKNKLKRKQNLQEKNRDNIHGHKITEINKTLRQLIILFYESKEFEKFCQEKKNEKINENVKLQKNNQYSLFDNSEYNGFIKMIEEDCGLNTEQKNVIRNFTNYFHDRELNIEELKKYRAIALCQKKV